MKTKVKPRSTYAEYTILIKYFGSETVGIWFNNFSGYEDAREKASYQQVFEVLNDTNLN